MNESKFEIKKARSTFASFSRKRFHHLLALLLSLSMLGVVARAQNATTNAAPVTPAVPANDGIQPQTGDATSTQLSKVVVKGTALTPTNIAQHKLDQVAGGTSVIDTDTLSKAKIATVADALRDQPGILAQSVNGGEATRLSIRGSGIIRAGFLFGFGNQLEIDGLRLYSTSGNPYEEVDPLTTSHIDILRGANGFNDGPLSLGGVINYVTHTGYDSSPVQARIEGGSYGYLHEQVSSGLVNGAFDYYLSLTHFEQSGYRNYTSANSSRAVFNFGYKIDDDLTTRFKVIYADQHQDDAGYLTWAQFQANPKQSQFPQIRVRDNPGSFLISNQTDLKIDGDSSIDNGFQYNNYPINSLGGPAQTSFLFSDISDTLRYRRKDLLFDHQSDTTISLLAYKQLNSEFDSYNIKNALTGRRPGDLGDYTLVESNDFEIIPHLWSTTALAEIYQTRETSINYSVNALTTPSRISRDYFNVDPRVGFRYDFNDKDQVFLNVSRSVDTPSTNSYVRTDANQAPLGIIDLNPAEATTVEIGTRGAAGPFAWNADFYHSWVDNELLTVPVAPGSTATISSNATPTEHMGIEAHLDATLWQDKNSPMVTTSDPKNLISPDSPIEESPQRLVLRQTYTWNDFYYANDPQFGHNQLAGVPEHIYSAELEYDHPCGFYAGVNVESVLTKYAVDFANSFYTQPYALLGAKIGYAQEKQGWEVFVEGRNLTDENYVAAVNPVFRGGGTAAVFAPGVGRAIYAGFSYHY